MKKILVLAAVLGFGFATLGYADMTPTAAAKPAAMAPAAKKAHKAHKHHKHTKHSKKAVKATAAPMAAPTKAAN